jgi:hypothetical protein
VDCKLQAREYFDHHDGPDEHLDFEHLAEELGVLEVVLLGWHREWEATGAKGKRKR